MYMEHQGYKFKWNELIQDNTIAMKMEKNGRNSCTGNHRHRNIRYFFVKDTVNKKKTGISHCTTDIMLSDYFTNVFQGRIFYMFREVIMGWKKIITLYQISVP